MEGRTIKRLLTTALILAAGLALPVNAAPKSVGYPAQAYYIQACTNEDKGDIKGAIEKMQRAIELKNDNALIIQNLQVCTKIWANGIMHLLHIKKLLS